MANCEIIVLGNPIPNGKLRLNDDNGFVSWQFIPMALGGNIQSGRVQQASKDYILKSNATTFGTIKNFSLYQYNAKIKYTVTIGNKPYNGKIEEDEFGDF